MNEARSEAGSCATCGWEDIRPTKAVIASMRVKDDMLSTLIKLGSNHSSTPLRRRSQSGRAGVTQY